MIMHADGELQPAEEQALMAFVEAHPELKSELAIYDRTHLVPDETQVYADKSSLLQRETSTRIIAFPQWKRYAAAASIAALLFISFLKYKVTSNSGSELVKTDTIKKNAPAPQNNTPAPLAQIPEQNNPIAPLQKEKITDPAHQVQNVAVVHNTKVKHTVQYPKTLNEKDDVCGHVLTSEQMEAAPIAEVQLLNNNSKAEPALSPLEVPVFKALAASPADHEKDGSFIDRLPIDESNKNQLKAIARLADGAAKAKQHLDDNRLTFRVEDKKLKISF